MHADNLPVAVGSFEGDRLRGKVLAGGGDWVTARRNGMLTLDLRIALETDDGSLIHMTFTGIRDDAKGYFRTVSRFETAAPRYEISNRLLAVGTAEIRPEGPVHLIDEILRKEGSHFIEKNSNRDGSVARDRGGCDRRKLYQ